MYVVCTSVPVCCICEHWDVYAVHMCMSVNLCAMPTCAICVHMCVS